MALALFFCILSLAGVLSLNVEGVEISQDADELALLAMGENVVDPLFSVAGYVPDGTPFSNPSTLSDPTPIIPSAPDCTVRPQTIVEIQRMRAQSYRIAKLIDQEVVIMGKRKAYVEQMTNYLNDRIRELNRVKAQLGDELKWIEVSQNKIEELQEREKLAKLQDILSCLTQDTYQLEGDKQIKSQTINTLQQQSERVLHRINSIKSTIDRVNGINITANAGNSTGAKGAAGAAGGAGGAAGAAPSPPAGGGDGS